MDTDVGEGGTGRDDAVYVESRFMFESRDIEPLNGPPTASLITV